MADFPRRMRDWLFNIMRDMADRQELTPHYLKMEREAESNLTRRWTNAAIWKFCDLDGHPPDRSVSRHELFPIRAPLMSLEHCIAPFLDSCDADSNHKITLKEWAKCLALEEVKGELTFLKESYDTVVSVYRMTWMTGVSNCLKGRNKVSFVSIMLLLTTMYI